MNLWSDFDNAEQQPATVAVYGRIRRLTEHVVLSTLRDWLLHGYVASYCRSLAETRIFRRCYLIDALGTEGRSSAEAPPDAVPSLSNEEVAPRTSKGRKKSVAKSVPPALQPVVSLSQALAEESKPITLYGLTLEAGVRKRKRAKIPPQELSIPGESGIVHADWLEAATTLLAEIGQSPAIFLLNPFGQALFTYEHLAPLYQRTVPTELCLLIPHKQVEARLLAAQRSPDLATGLTALLRSDRWKTLPLKEEEMAQAVDSLIMLFVASMQRHFLFPVQRILWPVQVRPALVENVPYTMIFATRRQDSLFSMNDALCSYRRQVYEQSPRGVLGEAWFAAQLRERLEEQSQQLYQRIVQLGRIQRLRRWPDLRQQVLLDNFGLFLVREYDAIMYKLLLNAEVRCEWRRKPVEGEEDRLPGTDDTLVW